VTAVSVDAVAPSAIDVLPIVMLELSNPLLGIPEKFVPVSVGVVE
jgi:hypothetical protein